MLSDPAGNLYGAVGFVLNFDINSNPKEYGQKARVELALDWIRKVESIGAFERSFVSPDVPEESPAPKPAKPAKPEPEEPKKSRFEVLDL